MAGVPRHLGAGLLIGGFSFSTIRRRRAEAALRQSRCATRHAPERCPTSCSSSMATADNLDYRTRDQSCCPCRQTSSWATQSGGHAGHTRQTPSWTQSEGADHDELIVINDLPHSMNSDISRRASVPPRTTAASSASSATSPSRSARSRTRSSPRRPHHRRARSRSAADCARVARRLSQKIALPQPRGQIQSRPRMKCWPTAVALASSRCHHGLARSPVTSRISRTGSIHRGCSRSG